MRYLVYLSLVAACQSADLLGPPPRPEFHLTALVDGHSFTGFVPAPGCIGLQLAPGQIVIDVHTAGSLTSPDIGLYLGGITGPGRFPMRPDVPPASQRAALYIPGDPAQRQYSAPAGSGEIVIDAYDPAARTVAGRFYFNAIRASGSGGPEWVQVRQGSFRGTLTSADSPFCQ